MTRTISLTIDRDSGPSRRDLVDSLAGDLKNPCIKYFKMRFWEGDRPTLISTFNFPLDVKGSWDIYVIICGITWTDDDRRIANISGRFKPFGAMVNTWFPFKGRYDTHTRTGCVELEYNSYSDD